MARLKIKSMRKRCVPFALADSIYELTPSFFNSLGVSVLLMDLDNTLATYDSPLPNEQTKRWAGEIEKAGIKIIICSNNSGKRVGKFAEELGCEHACWMKKPFSGPLKKLIAAKGLEKSKILLIGDQIMTDVKAGNGAGIRCILTEPLGKVEPLWTKFNRMFDVPLRRKIKKKRLSPNWRDCI